MKDVAPGMAKKAVGAAIAVTPHRRQVVDVVIIAAYAGAQKAAETELLAYLPISTAVMLAWMRHAADEMERYNYWEKSPGAAAVVHLGEKLPAAVKKASPMLEILRQEGDEAARMMLDEATALTDLADGLDMYEVEELLS